MDKRIEDVWRKAVRLACTHMHAHTAPQRPWIMDKRIEDVWRKAVRLACTHMHTHTAPQKIWINALKTA
jgi:hypothetical protein